jgi:hypothetical protein
MDTAGLEMSDNFISIAEGQKDDVMSINKSYAIAFLFGVTA